ncbi:hypothetical protein ACFW08_20215 [Streptomyces sp. NPDC058960]|uniref:hypothetical protein n=1 Tax=Streptomyces sp. NPDC058960 TaxID=3346679 RepID=UPI0036CFA7E9
MADDLRPLSELRDSGLLWLINRVAFHPRGVALALHQTPDGEVTGWRLLTSAADEPFTFTEETDNEGFRRAEATLRAALARKES